jgi:hypothetical protein
MMFRVGWAARGSPAFSPFVGSVSAAPAAISTTGRDHVDQIIPPQQLAELFSPKQISSMHAGFLRKALPQDAHGDWLFATILFANKLRRMPTDLPLFNDYIYRIKTTSEIQNPLRVFVTDKEFMKIYVKAMVGDEFNVPTLQVLHSSRELRAYEFPDACCVKPTHLSGYIALRRAGETLDLDEMERWFEINHYDTTREINYKNLNPKIIVEPLVFDEINITDYKIFCFGGEPKMIQVDLDRHAEHTRKIFDIRWNEQNFSTRYPKNERPMLPPDNLNEMLEISRTLSEKFSFVSIDLYSNGKICRVGEITNCPGSGLMKFIPVEAEEIASKMIFG